MVDQLRDREVLLPEFASALRQVVGFASRAIHGEAVDPELARELGEFGSRMLDVLRIEYEERVAEPAEIEEIAPDDVEAYDTARYGVTTVVPLVEGPHKNVRIVNQEGLDNLLEGYEEYAPSFSWELNA